MDDGMYRASTAQIAINETLTTGTLNSQRVAKTNPALQQSASNIFPQKELAGT